MSERVDVQQLRDLLERERSEIVRLTYRMKPEVAGQYFEKVDAAQAALDALEEVADATGQYIDLLNEQGEAPDAPLILALARLREGEA